MKVKKNYKDIDSCLIDELSNEFKLDKKIINYLIYLGYTDKTSIQTFLNPDFSFFHSPYKLSGMNDAVNIINDAVRNKLRILIFGDYDVDGIGATSILVKYFQSLNIDVDYFLPSRYDDGYGLTIETIDKVINLFNPELIITVDCGIACYKEVEYIISKGINIIVTDHHDIPEIIPDCIVINPKLKDQEYPFKNLCGAGVALKLVYALSDLNTALEYFSIAALSTISDVMELKDENRLIVKFGLDNYKTYLPIGVIEFLKFLKIDKLTSTDVSYKLVPKLNAAGRMGDATIALKLYLESNISKIQNYIQQLTDINSKRQECCYEINKEAILQVNQQELFNNNILVVSDENWECGVLGIVAAKMVETYKKPTIVLTYDKRVNRYVGSARSVNGVNIHELISNCERNLTSFGGHSMACGLSVERENLTAFKELLYSQKVTNAENSQIEKFDIELEPSTINTEFISQLDRLEPTGAGNPRPSMVINAPDYNISYMKNHNNHLNINIDNINIVGFNSSKNYYDLISKDDKILFVNLSNEEFMNKTYAKAYLNKYLNLNTKGLSDEIINGNLIKQFLPDTNYKEVQTLIYSQLNLLTGSTLFISFNNDVNELNKWVQIDKTYYCIYREDCINNCLLISPNTIQKYNVRNIVIVSMALDSAIYNQIAMCNPDSNIYVIPATINVPKIKLSFERKTFALCYNDILKNCSNTYFDDYHFYKFINTRQYNYAQFVLCYKTFEELGILKIEYEKNKFKIEITGKTGNLDNSRIVHKIKEVTSLYE